MSSARRIENEEAYERSLSWLVMKAAELEDPLIDSAKREKLQRQYDFVADEVQRYRRGQLAVWFPGLREIYKRLGWKFDDPEAEQAEAPESALVEPETPPVASALANWLDDE